MTATILKVDAPFATSVLKIQGNGQPTKVTEPSVVDQSMLHGLTVDKCVLGKIEIDTSIAKAFSLSWKITPAEHWSADLDTGENLDAYSFETSEGSEAAMGMRDAQWLCRKFNLRVLNEFYDGLGCQIDFEASQGSNVVVEFAAAWLTKPDNEEAAIAPWVAIDRAMKF